MKITIQDTKLTARDAAEKFAATYFGEPRKIGDWKPSTRHDTKTVALFRLANGIKTYAVTVTPDHDGWEISDGSEP